MRHTWVATELFLHRPELPALQVWLSEPTLAHESQLTLVSLPPGPWEFSKESTARPKAIRSYKCHQTTLTWLCRMRPDTRSSLCPPTWVHVGTQLRGVGPVLRGWGCYRPRTGQRARERVNLLIPEPADHLQTLYKASREVRVAGTWTALEVLISKGEEKYQFLTWANSTKGLSRWLNDKEPTCQWKRHRKCGFDPGVGKIPSEGIGNPLQYSSWNKSMDRGVWGTIVNGVAKQTKKIILNGFLSIGSTQRRGEQDFMLGSSKLTAMQI